MTIRDYAESFGEKLMGMFPKIIYKVRIKDKLVALTFDDGPHPLFTNELLDLFEENGIKTTFFVTGSSIEKHKKIISRMIAEGHELGNHSYSHKNLIFKKKSMIKEEIEKTDRLLRELGVKSDIHFRPPFGRFLFAASSVLASLNKKVIIGMDGEKIEIDEKFFDLEEVEEYEKYIPHVIEPSYGIDRIFYSILEHNYKEIEKEGEKYTLLSLPPSIAPIKVGVFPLVSKDGLPEIAKEIEKMLRKNNIMCFYDEKGSIGRRYARMDEIGTPFCITVDYQSKEDNTVTIRFRDTTEQIRINIKDIPNWIKEKIYQ